MTDNCFILLIHNIDKDRIKYIEYLYNEVKYFYDFYIIYNGKKLNNEKLNKFNIIYDNQDILIKYNKNISLPNVLLLLFNFYKQYTYKHYFIMEYDIIYNGRFRNFIEKINYYDDVDLIHIATDIDSSPRYHWPINFIKNNPFKRMYFSWMHMFYISYELLDKIHYFFNNINDTIYYEFLVPTIAYNGNFYIRQFENFGVFFEVSAGPSNKCETKYILENKLNTFYHPIKNHSIIQYNNMI